MLDMANHHTSSRWPWPNFKSQRLDESSVVHIHRQYGDHSYVKGNCDGAMAQFVKAIGQTQPSYHFRKAGYNCFIIINIMYINEGRFECLYFLDVWPYRAKLLSACPHPITDQQLCFITDCNTKNSPSPLPIFLNTISTRH